MQEALGDLRRALERPLAPLPPETGTTLAAELERGRRRPGAVVEVDWRRRVEVPADLEPLAQSVLAEALRNIAKHADPLARRGRGRARRGHVHARGAQRRRRGPGAADAGMGLRLAAFEALQQGGVGRVRGRSTAGGWRVAAGGAR